MIEDRFLALSEGKFELELYGKDLKGEFKPIHHMGYKDITFSQLFRDWKYAIVLTIPLRPVIASLPK